MSHKALLSVYSLAATIVLALLQQASAQNRTQQTDLRQEYQNSLTAVPAPASLHVHGTIYVLAYSAITAGSRRTRINLSTTLTIHNTSGQKPLVVESVEYFDMAGNLVERFLDGPLAIRPHGTIAIIIAADDERGGTGANFIVGWAASRPTVIPIVETVMIGTSGTAGYSFVSQGRPIETSPESQ